MPSWILPWFHFLIQHTWMLIFPKDLSSTIFSSPSTVFHSELYHFKQQSLPSKQRTNLHLLPASLGPAVYFKWHPWHGYLTFCSLSNSLSHKLSPSDLEWQPTQLHLIANMKQNTICEFPDTPFSSFLLNLHVVLLLWHMPLSTCYKGNKWHILFIYTYIHSI